MQTYIVKLEARLKEVEGKVKKPVHESLLVGDQTVAGVGRHLPDVISIILTNASLEEYEATIKKDENNYNNIYIVTAFQQSDMPEIKPLTSVLKSAKAKALIGVTISSILPKMEADYHNTCVQKINRKLENLCREMDVQFVHNDVNFKNLDGSVKDEYFSEDGETLADTGLRRLLRNMGLAVSPEKKQTNIYVEKQNETLFESNTYFNYRDSYGLNIHKLPLISTIFRSEVKDTNVTFLRLHDADVIFNRNI